MSTLTLEQFSPRGLNLLGLIFAGDDVRVLLSTRARNPATVVLESRTVVLDPTRTNLYDLALCARILKHRGLLRLRSREWPRHERGLTRKARHQVVPRAVAELHQEYPGIGGLPGRFRPPSEFRGLRVAVRTVEWDPLPPLPDRQTRAAGAGQPPRPVIRRPGEPWSVTDLEFRKVPELDITGAGDDFEWLLDAIRKGHFPLQAVPELDDLPFLAVPFRLVTGENCPLLEPLEERASDPEMKETIQALMECYRSKSEVRQTRSNLGRHTRHGVRLDTNRLVEAVLARKDRSRPRLFRRRATTIEPIFDPSEHLVVIAFDVNDLKREEDWEDFDRREGVQRFLACIVTAFRRLEVDCIVLGFADQILELPDGRQFCLHLTTTVKAIDDDYDGAFWNRLGNLLTRPAQMPGKACCFHPLGLHDIREAFDRVARGQEHSYRSMQWWARRGMPGDFPQFRSAEFLMRVADHVDAQVLDMEQSFPGTLDTMASFLPEELKRHGRPGQYLSGVEF